MSYFENYSYIELASCLSTNSYIKECLNEIKDNFPLLLLSREQTKGKGRDQRVWESKKNKGLYFTLAFCLNDLKKLPYIPLCAGVALQETLNKLYGISTTLKWPNDLIYQGKKLSGILCETIIKGDLAFIFCGIGLNTKYKEDDFPLQLRETAVSLEQLNIKKIDEKSFFDLFIKIFDEKINSQSSQLIGEFNDISKELIGKRISFHSGKQISQGNYLGLGDRGQCLLQDEKGEIKEYFFGEMVY